MLWFYRVFCLRHSVVASCSNGLRCLSVHLCHTWISPKLSRIDVWLLGNSNRNPGFPIQSLPSDSQSEVRFFHFGCSRVACSYKLYRADGTTLGTVAGQLSSCPITDDTLFDECFVRFSFLIFCCLIFGRRSCSRRELSYVSWLIDALISWSIVCRRYLLFMLHSQMQSVDQRRVFQNPGPGVRKIVSTIQLCQH